MLADTANLYAEAGADVLDFVLQQLGSLSG